MRTLVLLLLFVLIFALQPIQVDARVGKVTQARPKLELTTTVLHSEYCSSPSNLALTLQLRFTNVGNEPILLQKKSSVIGGYMISRTLRKAANRDYLEAASFTLDWTAAGFTPDTPDRSAFTKLGPGESYSTERELRIPVFEEKDLQAGKYFLQIKVPTWYYDPNRSSEFRGRWKQEGFLWTATITSIPMPFEVKRGEPTRPCG